MGGALCAEFLLLSIKKSVSDGEINKAVSDHLKRCCAAGDSASFV